MSGFNSKFAAPDANRRGRGGGTGGGGSQAGTYEHRGGGSGRRRFRRGVGGGFVQRGGRSSSSQNGGPLPQSPEDWELKLARESNDAFLDFTLSFANSGIPVLRGMLFDFWNPGSVAGQETLALMMASIKSMQLGSVVDLDGAVGGVIRPELVEREFSRVLTGTQIG